MAESSSNEKTNLKGFFKIPPQIVEIYSSKARIGIKEEWYAQYKE